MFDAKFEIAKVVVDMFVFVELLLVGLVEGTSLLVALVEGTSLLVALVEGGSLLVAFEEQVT